jgi:ABC-type transport system involved in multi-copper enzyme maturation permease subunit
MFSRLLKLHFYTLYKDILVIVMSIVFISYGFVSILIYLGTLEVFDGTGIFGAVGIEVDHITSNSPTTLMSLPAILLLIMIAVHFSKEFTNGTIRNQLVSGFTRKEIYLSQFIVMISLVFGLLIATQAIELMVMGFYSGASSVNLFTNFQVDVYFLQLLIFVTTAALAFFLTMMFHNVVAPILITIGYVLGPLFLMITFLGGIGDNGLSNILSIMQFFPAIQSFFLSVPWLGNLLTDLDGGISSQISLSLLLKTTLVNGSILAIATAAGPFLLEFQDFK